MLARWIRLWFGFSEPVDRGTYLRVGLGLTAIKYALDAVLVARFAGIVWTPLNYLSPLWTTRQALLSDGPSWLLPLMAVIALPFLWIGVSMTMRRAVDAGLSPGLALLFFLPGINLLLMLFLCLPASKPIARGTLEAEQIGRSQERFRSAMLGVAASLGIALISVLVGIYLKRQYSAGFFLGVPFTIGYISSYIYNQHVDRPAGESVLIALVSVTVAAGAMVVFALEGLICIGMALPLAWAIAWPGAVLGHAMARRGAMPTGVGMALVVPLFLAIEPHRTAPTHDVVTVIEIAAPPDIVWRHVISFPNLPPPTERLFRLGVAAPMRARIEGQGAGATRYCDFTTGSFVEPITVWKDNAELAFDITAQALPMDELSPYPNLHPPHLDGYFRATHGEFRLTPLPGGRTRLEGRTTYVVDMFPQTYWTVPARAIVSAIHERVLRHIQALSEMPKN
jgi:hypothetical protein